MDQATEAAVKRLERQCEVCIVRGKMNKKPCPIWKGVRLNDPVVIGNIGKFLDWGGECKGFKDGKAEQG